MAAYVFGVPSGVLAPTPPPTPAQPAAHPPGAGVWFEDLPLDQQLALSASYQNELKSRPRERRGPGALSAAGGDCTRYFKRVLASGRVEWKVLTGQPCGPTTTPRPGPQPPPRPTPPPRPPPVRRRVCYDGSKIIRHIEGLLQNGAGVYGGLGAWKTQGIQIIAESLPVCRDQADVLRARQLELRNRISPPATGMPVTVPAAIQMYDLQLRKTKPALWRDQQSLPE